MANIKNFIERLESMNERAKYFTKKESEVFTFCFFLIGFLEKTIEEVLRDTLLETQKLESKYPKLIDYLMKERTFRDKIKILRFIMKRGKKKTYESSKGFIAFCETVNQGIRNNLFHFKIDELEYKGMNVSETKTQVKIMRDFDLILDKIIKYNENND